MGSPPLPNVTGFHTPFSAPRERPGTSDADGADDADGASPGGQPAAGCGAGAHAASGAGDAAGVSPGHGPDPTPATDQLASWISDLTTLQKLAERLPDTRTVDDALHETLRAGATLAGARRGLISLGHGGDAGPGPNSPGGSWSGPGDPARPGTPSGHAGHPVTADPPYGRPDRLVGLGLSPGDLGDIETVPRSSASHSRLLDGADRTAAEIVVQDIPREEGLDPRHREVAARLGFAASYAQPLTDQNGRRIGAAVWFYDEPAHPGPRQRHLLARYLRQAAWHITNRLELARAHDAVREVQRGLLERRLPRVPGVTLVVRREPGHGPPGGGTGPTRGTDGRAATTGPDQGAAGSARRGADAPEHTTAAQDRRPDPAARPDHDHRPGHDRRPHPDDGRTPPCHGGAFHEALQLPEGALGLAIGTVTGSGPGRTAAMGRLLAGLRAYAVMEGEDPVAVLGDLELLLRVTESARSATALFGYAEPATRRVLLASAGHPPPLVVGPERVTFAETALSAPLAMLACWEAPSVEITLAPGETLLLYSEGLLHRTGEPLNRALPRLRAAAESAPAAVRDDPERLTSHLLRTLTPGVETAAHPAGDGAAARVVTAGDEATLLAARF